MNDKEKFENDSSNDSEVSQNQETEKSLKNSLEIFEGGYNSSSSILQESLPMLQKVVNQKIKLIEAVKVRYPEIETEVAEKFVDAMFAEIMQRLYQGEEVSFIKHLPDGSVVLTPFSIETKEK